MNMKTINYYKDMMKTEKHTYYFSLNQKEQIEENVDEYVILSGKELDVDEQLREELVLSFPQKLLCDEDCEGLCPKCGKRRADGPCGCPEKEIDPRLAVLKNFFNEEK